jgi:hypothetical protein
LDKYQEPGNINFRKTHVPIKLGKYPGEQLVSRSQARRILARFDRFSEVFLDFSGIDQIGPAFADEIFRVFARQHQDINMIYVSAAPAVMEMIESARNSPPDEDVQNQLALFSSGGGV